MRAIFFPKRERIYSLFGQAAKELMKAAAEFNILLGDLSQSTTHAQVIASYERQADKIANATFEYLHRTFITPFDHYDIQQIIIKLDDILDAIYRMAQRIAVYQLNVLPREIVLLGDLCIRLSTLVDNGISLLSSLKNAQKILTVCDEIGKFKNDGEQQLTQGIAHLFQNENDIKILIKIKDIYECSRLIIDKYEDLANVVKSIILEYS